jgi:hypothetical protein
MLKNFLKSGNASIKPFTRKLFIVLFLSPYLVAFTPNPEDTSSTALQLAMGRGSFTDINRDCHGPRNIVDVPFEEAAISIDHFESPMRYGVKAGIVQNEGGKKSFYSILPEKMERVEYVNPNIGINMQHLGVDIGVISILNKPYKYPDVILNGGVRFGNKDHFYFSSSFLNNVPLVSGGCLYDFGVGFRPWGYPVQLWTGLGFQPDDGAMFSLKSQIPVAENLSLNVKGQYGLGEMKESGLSLGTTIQF